MPSVLEHFNAALRQCDARSTHHELAALRESSRAHLSEALYPNSKRSGNWRWSQHLLHKKCLYNEAPTPMQHDPWEQWLHTTETPTSSLPTLRFCQGRYINQSSSAQAEEWSLAPLHQVLAEEPKLLEDFCRRSAAFPLPLFHHLCLSFLADAYVLTIHRSPAQPLLLDFAYTFMDEASTLQPLLHIRLEEGCQAEIREHHRAFPQSAGGLYNCALHVDLAAHSTLHHSTFTTPGAAEIHLHNRRVVVGHSSRYQHLSAMSGSKLSRQQLSVLLAAPQGEVDLQGVSFQDQHLDHQVEVLHRAPHTISRQHYKSALSGEGRGACRGSITLDRCATSSQADLLHRHLLLSPRAQVHAQPQLISDTDEVKASHGATVTQISEEDLWYLTCRGISQSEAQSIMIRGFLCDILRRWPEKLRDHHFENLLFAPAQK